MRIVPRTISLALALLGSACAQDAIFEKVALVGASGVKTTPVQLVLSDTGATIRSKDKTPSVIVEIPYSSVSSLGYAFVEQGKVYLLPVLAGD